MVSKRISFLLALFFSCSITMTAWGDDLEIYLGTNDTAETFPPNVLFIMDTSGSMSNRDGGTDTRLRRVQNALVDVLGSATNINAGLMRFSNIGGPILYPVTNIDAAADSEIIIFTGTSANDAHEINNVMSVTNDAVRLTNGTDDVYAGFRFEGLNIPQGATITRAFIRYASSALDSSNAEINLHGELTSDSESFSTTSGNISSRDLTNASVAWSSNLTFPPSGELLSTPDITNLVQEVVDQEAWCGGNAFSVIAVSKGVSAASAKRVFSADEGSAGAPQLVVNYDSATATGCVGRSSIYQVENQANNVEERSNGTDNTGNELTFRSNNNDFIAVRFSNVQIPNSATIKSARLIFTAYSNSNDDPASMNISVVNRNNLGDFSSHQNYSIRDIAKTGEISMSIPELDKNDEFSSPELKSIVQTVINRSGWQSGNALGFVMSDFTGIRGAYTFNGQPSGAVRLAIEFTGNAEPGTSQTVRELLINQVNQFQPAGTTPIVDTLFEAANYYGGNDVLYGLRRGNSNVGNSIRRNTRVSSEASYIGLPPVRPNGCDESNLNDSDCVNEFIPDGAKYISPIVDLQCQTNNHIVLLSDGNPVGNVSKSLIRSALGINSCSGSGDGECGVELVQNISDPEKSIARGKVTTHTIGFASNASVNNYLNRLAVQGGGGFYTAGDSTDLIDAFNSILRSVKDVNTTFVSPGVAVNQLNRLTHRDDLYFALFKPSEGTVWPGNLKKYTLGGGDILDRDGVRAVDNSTGFFSDSAHSFWSVLQDGNNVEKGGAASKITATRNLYMFNEAGDIVSTKNRLHESNSDITAQMLNVHNTSSPAELRELVLKWARGVDVLDDDGDGDHTEIRLAMGDPIHSQPAVVDYSATDTAVFVATNQGFLHSIDAETGSENFAIIPQELLGNLPEFYENASSFTHVYGLDGDLVLRNVDGKKYLYVGMRRGGNSYYVIDVTNKTAPSLVFSVRGGSPGLEKLGQTWSRPTLTKVRIGSSERNVMIVGGGYDETQDDKSIRSPDVVGNAVFMFDADTGALLWSASNANASLNLTEMQYSIPGRISAIDRDTDGFVDHLYVADMGGQLFRFDIYNGESGDDFIKGARIADFAGSSEADNRRFYYGPDVSEIALGSDLYYAVAIGSGKRASPLDTTIEDRFYMLRDSTIFALDDDGNYPFPSVATESDMYDATAELLTSQDDAVRAVESSEFANKSGWLIKLNTAGEKVLASPLIIDFNIFFTTYVPAVSSTSSCAPPAGSSRAYLVSLTNGNAVIDNRPRSVDLNVPGIPPEPRIFITDGGLDPVICLGTECESTTVKLDDKGQPVAPTSDFERLANSIFGNFERVRRSSWSTETEGQ